MPFKVPISALRVFEAAARRQSFQAAATELNLTPSAVSHSIRKMEEALGVVLFERVGRGVSLSSEGQTLMGYTERAFEELQRGLEAVSARAPRLLRLHCAIKRFTMPVRSPCTPYTIIPCHGSCAGWTSRARRPAPGTRKPT